MSWAEIKKSLNSSIGTSDFKPLDVQIAEQFRFVPSDEIYQSLEQFATHIPSKTYNNKFVLPYKLKMTRKGTARFKCIIETGEYQGTYGTLTILKNNVAVKTFNFNNKTSGYLFNFSVDIIFGIGDLFTFELVASNEHSMSSNNVSVDIDLCGEAKQDIFDFVE